MGFFNTVCHNDVYGTIDIKDTVAVLGTIEYDSLLRRTKIRHIIQCTKRRHIIHAQKEGTLEAAQR